MHLNTKDMDKLNIFTVGLLAERRKERGLKLNYTEAVAYLSAAMLEMARDGNLTLTEVMNATGEVLTADDVMDGVPEMLTNIQVEATFPDGNKLISVDQPIK